MLFNTHDLSFVRRPPSSTSVKQISNMREFELRKKQTKQKMVFYLFFVSTRFIFLQKHWIKVDAVARATGCFFHVSCFGATVQQQPAVQQAKSVSISFLHRRKSAAQQWQWSNEDSIPKPEIKSKVTASVLQSFRTTDSKIRKVAS